MTRLNLAAGLAAALLLVAACSSTATPSPAATPGVSPTPSPTPTVAPTPIPTATPTPPGTASPPPTASQTREVTHKPDALETALNKWVSEKGNTGIPTSKEWMQFGKRQGLTLDDGSKDSVGNSNYTPEYFTLDKGTVVIPDANGVSHLALPILQVDGAGNHYFFLANLGPLDSSEKCPVSLVPTRNNVGIVPETQWLTQTQLQTALNNSKGDIFNIFYEYADESFPNPSPLLQEFLKAKPIDRALADFTLKASQPGVSYKSLLVEFPDIAKLINAYPTEVDATAMPFPSGFEVASLPK